MNPRLLLDYVAKSHALLAVAWLGDTIGLYPNSTTMMVYIVWTYVCCNWVGGRIEVHAPASLKPNWLPDAPEYIGVVLTIWLVSKIISYVGPGDLQPGFWPLGAGVLLFVAAEAAFTRILERQFPSLDPKKTTAPAESQEPTA